MKKRKFLNIDAWNLNELVMILNRNAKSKQEEPQKTYPIINTALSLAKKFEVQSVTYNLIRSTQASLEVAMIAASEMCLGISTVIAAILYPIFLADLMSKIEIEQLFDVSVVAILEELAMLKDYKIQNDTIQNYPHHPDITSPHVLAILLQVADFIRIYCSGLVLEPEEEEAKSRVSSSQILLHLKCFYIPISHRLCLYDVQTKLSDFWLKHVDTLSYYYITAKIGATKIERKRKLDRIVEEIGEIMKVHGINFFIKNRIKCVYSIWNKIQKLNVNFDKIYDLSAIRIIITGTKDKTIEEEKTACWKVFSILSKRYEPIYAIMRDWISVPKPSGYESLHITLLTKDNQPFEVQIRTERMDHIAEFGNAAHWKYKSN
ncbi:MAG: bifunctional (p)ppGpp synthetase/guanosine-3',5'-bis(diphosphate) 3'-pyrophosphohydrolase [Amoebophilaceae bacterium]|nr:bifunctional (p)ppGpp synthetase/guanosine-3',5'-bis(diphosphate) 3'-pyrophosphohydrolase [Amoebophilaceae bacterium]